MVVALVVGLLVSTVATLEPAYRSTARPPLDALREARRPTQRPRMRAGRVTLCAMALVGLAAASGMLGSISATTSLGLIFASSLGLMILLLGPAMLPALRLLSPVLEAVVPRIGTLVGLGLLARPTHTSLTVTGIAAVVGGLSGIVVVLTSVAESFEDWIGERYPGAVLFTAGDVFQSTSEMIELVPEEIVQIIRETAGVGPVLESFASTMLYADEEIALTARSYDVLAEHGRLSVISADSAEVSRALHLGGVDVYEAFSRRLGVVVGQDLTLSTPSGPQSFEVVGVVRDYAGPAGTIHIDVRTLDRYWGTRRGASAVVIWPPGPLGALETLLRERLKGQRTLFFTKSEEYSKYMSRLFDRFLGLVYAVVGLTGLLCGAALVNLMFGAVVDRRHELSLLRTAGATRLQVGELVMIDGIAVAVLGAGFGLVLGLLSSTLMCLVLTESMGWTIERIIHWMPLLGVGLVAAVIGGLAGLIPAVAAARTVPTEALLRQ